MKWKYFVDSNSAPLQTLPRNFYSKHYPVEHRSYTESIYNLQICQSKFQILNNEPTIHNFDCLHTIRAMFYWLCTRSSCYVHWFRKRMVEGKVPTAIFILQFFVQFSIGYVDRCCVAGCANGNCAEQRVETEDTSRDIIPWWCQNIRRRCSDNGFEISIEYILLSDGFVGQNGWQSDCGVVQVDLNWMIRKFIKKF